MKQSLPMYVYTLSLEDIFVQCPTYIRVRRYIYTGKAIHIYGQGCTYIRARLYIYKKGSLYGFLLSGERGIQTPGTDKPFTGFRVRPNRSLWHLSKVRVLSIAGAKVSINNELRLTKDEKKFVEVRFFRSNRYFLLFFACSSALCNRVARALMYLCSVKRENDFSYPQSSNIK